MEVVFVVVGYDVFDVWVGIEFVVVFVVVGDGDCLVFEVFDFEVVVGG